MCSLAILLNELLALVSEGQLLHEHGLVDVDWTKEAEHRPAKAQ